MVDQDTDELRNKLLESLIARDEKLFKKIIDGEEEETIKLILQKFPVNYVRKLIIELGNLLSTEITTQRLKWVQLLLATKYSVISTMPDGRSILMPILSILDDRSSIQYYNKLLGLKGKITLVKQLKENR